MRFPRATRRNAVTGNRITSYWAADPYGQRVRPYVQLEDFGVTPAGE